MNDIETSKEKGFKVHKLPTRLHAQERFIEDFEKTRCDKLLGIYGNPHYL